MSPINWAPIIGNLQRFLINRGWVSGRVGEKTEEYRPPNGLAGLSKEFTLIIPRPIDASDVGRFVHNALRTLAELYEYSLDQIEPVIYEADAVFSVRIEDEATSEGSIEFPRFKSLVEQLQKIILHTTASTTNDDLLLQSIPLEAQIYLDSCRFLQTTRGSFITNVQLPTREIVPRSIEGKIQFDSQAVVDKLEDSLAYVSREVLNSEEDIFTEAHLEHNLPSINIDILNDIRAIVDDSSSSSLSFSVVGIKSSSNVATGTITPQKAKLLKEYVKFVRSSIGEQFQSLAEGKVIELRSRNPRGNRNYIAIDGKVNNKPSRIALTLNNELYEKAVRAHRNHHKVRISGTARQMKSQVKFSSVDEFDELDS